jgi:cytosine/adenosine deaminase-related metal-dependent hydrolase
MCRFCAAGIPSPIDSSSTAAVSSNALAKLVATASPCRAISVGLGDQIGTIAPGMQADIIAMDGDPLKDATSVRRVLFVMKGGTIFKNDIPIPVKK